MKLWGDIFVWCGDKSHSKIVHLTIIQSWQNMLKYSFSRPPSRRSPGQSSAPSHAKVSLDRTLNTTLPPLPPVTHGKGHVRKGIGRKAYTPLTCATWGSAAVTSKKEKACFLLFVFFLSPEMTDDWNFFILSLFIYLFLSFRAPNYFV